MKNNISKVLISLALFVFLTSNNSLAFSDVSENHWAKPYIQYLHNKGLISGYPNGTFKPDDYISRAEVSKLISDMIKEKDYYGGNVFTDVGGWSEPYINHLFTLNLLSGYPDRTFKPGGNVTRAEFVEVAYKFYKHIGYNISNPPTSFDVSFNDIDYHWANHNINLMYYRGHINGYSTSEYPEVVSFKPDNYITRAEASAILSKIELWNFEPKHKSDTVYTAGEDIPVGKFFIVSNSDDSRYNTSSFMISNDGFRTTTLKKNFKGSTYIDLQLGTQIVFYNSYMVLIEDIIWDLKYVSPPTRGIFPEGMYRIGYDISAKEFKTYPHSMDKPVKFEFFSDNSYRPSSLISTQYIHSGRDYIFSPSQTGQYVQITDGAIYLK